MVSAPAGLTAGTSPFSSRPDRLAFLGKPDYYVLFQRPALGHTTLAFEGRR